mmetsp:Transcript_28749/g.93470  ORF Transcript_28749/g.93470 Transcript_28749/m.93470 type:complete len:285 (-) Transcript_28749:74-928(-)
MPSHGGRRLRRWCWCWCWPRLPIAGDAGPSPPLWWRRRSGLADLFPRGRVWHSRHAHTMHSHERGRLGSRWCRRWSHAPTPPMPVPPCNSTAARTATHAARLIERLAALGRALGAPRGGREGALQQITPDRLLGIVKQKLADGAHVLADHAPRPRPQHKHTRAVREANDDLEQLGLRVSRQHARLDACNVGEREALPSSAGGPHAQRRQLEHTIKLVKSARLNLPCGRNCKCDSKKKPSGCILPPSTLLPTQEQLSDGAAHHLEDHEGAQERQKRRHKPHPDWE